MKKYEEVVVKESLHNMICVLPKSKLIWCIFTIYNMYYILHRGLCVKIPYHTHKTAKKCSYLPYPLQPSATTAAIF